MQKARSIVYEILKEIETRVYGASPEKTDVNKRIQDEQRAVEDDVTLHCARGIPQKYQTAFKEYFGSDTIEYLEQGKLGSLVRKN